MVRAKASVRAMALVRARDWGRAKTWFRSKESIKEETGVVFLSSRAPPMGGILILYGTLTIPGGRGFRQSFHISFFLGIGRRVLVK